MQKCIEGMNGEVEEQPEIPHDSGFVNQPAKPSEISPETTVMVSGDRRRGRRKILKKKTIKDDEGFLGKERPLMCLSPYLSLMLNSNEGGTSLGVIFRGRSSCKRRENVPHGIYVIQKEKGRQTRSRKHHEFFRQK